MFCDYRACPVRQSTQWPRPHARRRLRKTADRPVALHWPEIAGGERFRAFRTHGLWHSAGDQHLVGDVGICATLR